MLPGCFSSVSTQTISIAMGFSGAFLVRFLKSDIFSNTDPVRDLRTLFSLLEHMWRKRRISIAELDPRLNQTASHHSPLLNIERYAGRGRYMSALDDEA